jgi:predicted ArsR family transcriptional regulator
VNRLEALARPELRAVLAFTRGRSDPPTAGDVAAGLGLARSVARWRLERLVESGHLVPVFAKRVGGRGAGRPGKTYAVAPETETLEFPRRRYVELLRLMLDTVPAARLTEIGAEFGRELAREAGLRPSARAETALGRVCDALGALGFQASVESFDRGQAVLVTPTCPLRPLVVAAPEARELDQGMWRGLVQEALQNAESMRCETHDCLSDGSCRVAIELRTA